MRTKDRYKKTTTKRPQKSYTWDTCRPENSGVSTPPLHRAPVEPRAWECRDMHDDNHPE
jgi:hypothetical protein